MFQAIQGKTSYLGKDRNKDTPQMPRKMVNKIWRNMLDDLGSHKTDASYMLILAAVFLFASQRECH